MNILSVILCLIFAALAFLHFSWALGNQWGFSSILPTNEHGEKVLNPRAVDCIVIGLGLTVFSLFYLLRTEMVEVGIPEWILKYGGWLIPAIFIVRAIGDFKYVGLFKKIRQTEFGKRDTQFYSPLCLMIGTVGVIIQLM
ncbi:DUF3995 domain-containing protein [Tunicatimonas pelagia]|uniref:DUF3995 domain-containing protein n=1 Tax=Tunicatimonas pelagia TaxID=931531 RepID=UPI0026660317|nr:DUF3995 domain-containing protein [Tunicatimonas pelagia]WKN46077.1 DUF3995 domain-containing protein [Tunicatimonas pelagia]